MDNKEEKKERRQGYFARLKKKRLSKQNSELTPANSHVTTASTPKDDSLKVILGQISEKIPDEEKKKKRIQGKQLRRSEVKRYSAGENYNNKNEKRDKKMVVKRPLGTVQYTATATDTLNCIALKFNITPNKLVELNRLFTHTIVPGQILYVPDGNLQSAEVNPKAKLGGFASPVSSDAEYDKLPDADLARKATKPIERVLSSTSEEEEPILVKFLKMNCRYITDGKGVVGGVMIVTPNNVMFDPHKSDPLVIENGCEEYGLICPMEEVVSIALYSDISHMKIKDALPSPGEWEDLSSEKDINPFSKFKSLNKEKKQYGIIEADIVKKRTTPCTAENHYVVNESKHPKNKIPVDLSTVHLNPVNQFTLQPEQASEITSSSKTEKAESCAEDDFLELVDPLEEQKVMILNNEEYNTSTPTVHGSSDSVIVEVIGPKELASVSTGTLNEDKVIREINSCFKIHQVSSETKNIEVCLPHTEENRPESKELLMSVPGIKEAEIKSRPLSSEHGEINVYSKLKEKTDKDNANVEESPDSLSPCSPEESSPKDAQIDSESELKLWLLKRMQGPIEDMLPSKEEKSKIPPMFLCIRVGKPMRKSFATQSAAMVQQYARKRKQPEYWFAVPQERVDHLYTFFVQWSPEVYGKDAKDQGFVVVEKDELHMIDNFFSEPSTKSWEIITVEEAKRRKSTCSYEEDEEEDTEDFLPDLKHKSLLLNDMHVEKLAHRLPARVQGYPWHLEYSTHKHGTSLKTLYRNLSCLDSPVLLVVKDMDNQVFGAYATHPFRLSDHYYGTGETFLFTFNPDFKIFKWSGENSYFINGDISSLEIGGGGGRFGLWLDSDLYHGRSNSCSTFKNETLSKKEDFIVQDVEVWAFV
ncbi:nuclear receptor coactivator 7 isoform X2 [Pelobates fuscus]|uniref:nuclear receptor coactivator 7 isoform X2 n=1 Tax=Pelobates fuscus TaxID=191477 RepID=UPI002FE48981